MSCNNKHVEVAVRRNVKGCRLCVTTFLALTRSDCQTGPAHHGDEWLPRISPAWEIYNNLGLKYVTDGDVIVTKTHSPHSHLNYITTIDYNGGSSS